MVSTRSSSKQTRRSPLAGASERHSIVRTFRGARYEVAGDGITWKTTETEHLAAGRRPAVSRQLTAEKERKRNDVELDDDEQFLAESIRRLERVDAPAKSFRKADIRKLLPYLKNMRPIKRAKVSHKAPGQSKAAPGAYELTDATAKSFFRSTKTLDAPIFLTGQQMPMIDLDSNIRPVEQIFDWLDMDEAEEVDDLRRLTCNDYNKCPLKTVTIAEIKERFLENDSNRSYPWNFPEVSLPTIAESMPDSLKHPNCNMMKDVACLLQSTDANDICQDSCPYHDITADRCPKHFVTTEELMVLRQTFTNWYGAIMMAEAGAITQPHFDSFGLGTYFCCAEGEIGFAWSATALEQPDGSDPGDRWFYKVMRAGDAVYMDPGRYHLVFRLPGGNQTCGYAPRILRYGDVVKWLEVLSQEIEDKYDYGGNDHPKLWRGIVIGARHLIDKGKKHGRVDKFGGEVKIRAAERVFGSA